MSIENENGCHTRKKSLKVKPLITSLFTLSLLMLPIVLWAQEGTIQIKIKGLSCPFCIYGVEKKLKKVPGVQSVTTHYKQATAILQKEESARVDVTALTKGVTDAGFTVDSIVLTVKGTLSRWKNYPALKDEKSGQLFLLMDTGTSHTGEYLSSEKLKKLKSLTQGNKGALVIEGKAHSHVDMPVALEIMKYRKAP